MVFASFDFCQMMHSGLEHVELINLVQAIFLKLYMTDFSYLGNINIYGTTCARLWFLPHLTLALGLDLANLDQAISLKLNLINFSYLKNTIIYGTFCARL